MVKRTDLDRGDPKARALAIADNRAVRVGLGWDPANLAEFSIGLDLQPFFSAAELTEIIAPDAAKHLARLVAKRLKAATNSNTVSFVSARTRPTSAKFTSS